MEYYKYYEDGNEKTVTMRKVYRMFLILVDEDQKMQGTTFVTWLAEMEKMQILNRLHIHGR